jgi:hypothetical protein
VGHHPNLATERVAKSHKWVILHQRRKQTKGKEGTRKLLEIYIPLFYKPATELVSDSPEYLSPDTLKGTSHCRNSTASLKRLHQILSIRKSLYEKAWTILKERQSSSEQNPSSKQKSFESSDLLEAWMPVMNCGISSFYAAPPWWFKDIEYNPEIGKLTEKGIPQFQLMIYLELNPQSQENHPPTFDMR